MIDEDNVIVKPISEATIKYNLLLNKICFQILLIKYKVQNDK